MAVQKALAHSWQKLLKKAMKYTLPEYIFLLAVSGCIICIGNAVGYDINITQSLPGMAILLAISCAGIILHMFSRGKFKKFPIIGWITLIGVLVSIPISPISAFVIEKTQHIELLSITTVVLAYVGISLGKDMVKLKQVGWKIAIVSLFVFGGTFLGSAVVAHVMLSVQGLI